MEIEKKFAIQPPFFEVGPKAYVYGQEFVELAKFADELTQKYDVRIILTPQYVDIQKVAEETEHVFVFAQHMDSLPVGRGIGAVLPEALYAAGAIGVLLNHIEKRLSSEELEKTITRAKEVGMMTMVCADCVNDAVAIAKLKPTIIVAEPPEMIGVGQRDADELSQICMIDEAVRIADKNILVLHGAGIRNARDVYNVITAGAIATGSSSAVFLAEDRFKVLEDMIRAVHEAWIERNKLIK